MLTKIALLVAAALAILLGYAATRPDTFRVERSTRVKAPPERIFALINDLKAFNTWSPYEKKDPALKGTYGQTASGTGARYGWVSSEVGVGSMEITESVAPSRVGMKLDFVKPFEAHNLVAFTLKPATDGSTEVTWAMDGPAPYISKLMGVIFNMDKMVGKDFEDGLANLKTEAEKQT